MIFLLKSSTEIKNYKLNIRGDYKMFYIDIFYIDFFFYYYILKKLFQPIYIYIYRQIHIFGGEVQYKMCFELRRK